SGVYTFACVCYQVFQPLGPSSLVLELSMISTGRSKPTWPASCPRTPVLDNLWDLFQECWTQNPRERLTAEQIVQRLVGHGIQATTNQSITDRDDILTAKFRRSLQVEPLLPSIAQLAHTFFWRRFVVT
ncbi:hypothetical protein DFH08DRAFT_698618, partial [Mycena albidolilacea]